MQNQINNIKIYTAFDCARMKFRPKKQSIYALSQTKETHFLPTSHGGSKMLTLRHAACELCVVSLA